MKKGKRVKRGTEKMLVRVKEEEKSRFYAGKVRHDGTKKWKVEKWRRDKRW